LRFVFVNILYFQFTEAVFTAVTTKDCVNRDRLIALYVMAAYEYKFTVVALLMSHYLSVWPSGGVVGRWTDRRWLSDAGLSGSNSGQVVHVYTLDSITKQYNLVPANGRWHFAAGKATVGLASHWHACFANSSSVSTYGSWSGDEHPASLFKEYGRFYMCLGLLLTLLLDAGIEASACARNSTTPTV